MYLHLHNIGKRMFSDIPALDGIKDRNVVIILGPTGSGKSTIANALISGLEHMILDEKLIQYTTDKPLNFAGRGVFDIGHEASSKTQTPGFHPLSDDGQVMLVDAAGFGDSDPYSEFPNMTLVNHAVKNARSVIVCFVIQGSSIQSN